MATPNLVSNLYGILYGKHQIEYCTLMVDGSLSRKDGYSLTSVVIFCGRVDFLSQLIGVDYGYRWLLDTAAVAALALIGALT